MTQQTRVNHNIHAPRVRVLDSTGNMLGVMSTHEAQRMATAKGLDLVEITPNANPPVCKIMDFGKYKYEQSIRDKQARKAQKQTQVKEIKFHPGTDIGDINHKLKQIREFLAEGNKVRLSLQFRGRENAHRDIGEDKISEVLEMLKDECSVEQAPKTDGRIHFCLIGPPRRQKIQVSKPSETSAPAPAPAPNGKNFGAIHIKIG